MPKTLIVEIVTPEKVALQGEAESVILPAHDPGAAERLARANA